MRAILRFQTCDRDVEKDEIEITDEEGQSRTSAAVFTIPGTFLRVDSALRLSHCGIAIRILANEVSNRAGDIEKRPGSNRALSSRWRRVLIQGILPTTTQHRGVAVTEFEKHLRVKDIRGAEKFARHGFNDIQNADLCAVRLSVTSWPLLVVQWLC